MKYGYFDDDKKEYVITDPQTPSPWINYFGTEGFFSLFSNTGGGYSFYRDALLRRITRYRYNNVPADINGRCFYLREDGKNADFWSPLWKPVMSGLDFYECRHGMGYSRIRSMKNELETDSLFFVPRGESCEIHRVRLTNRSSERKTLKFYSYIEFCLWNAQDDQTNFQRNLNTGEVEVDGGTIYHLTEYRERRNHFSFYSLNRLPDGFDTDRESFLGQNRGPDRPLQVMQGTSADSIAAARVNFILQGMVLFGR